MALARNKALIFGLKLLVSAGALHLIFRKTDVSEVLALLERVGFAVFLAVTGLYIVSQMLSTLRWRTLMPGHHRFSKLFALYMIGSFFNSFLPGLVGGDVVRAYYLNKDTRDLSTTLGAVFLDRYIGFVCLILIGITAYPFSLKSFGSSPVRWLMPVLFVSFAAGSLLFFWLRLGRRFSAIAGLYEYFSYAWTRKRMILLAFGISVLIQLVGIFNVLFLALRMEANVSLLELAVFVPIVITITSLPISIAGVGVREGTFVILLGLIGISPTTATSLSLAWFFTVLLGGLPGLGYYLLLGRQGKIPDGQTG